jgi:hypothetical protein
MPEIEDQEVPMSDWLAFIFTFMSNNLTNFMIHRFFDGRPLLAFEISDVVDCELFVTKDLF